VRAWNNSPNTRKIPPIIFSAGEIDSFEEKVPWSALMSESVFNAYFQTYFSTMKSSIILTIASLPLLIVSCAPKGGSNDYDVSNPYAAPDYSASDVGGPYQASDVNPAYDAPAVYEDTTPAPYDATASIPTPAAPASAAPRQVVSSSKTHIVGSGDSLWKISKKYGVSIDAIKQANGMKNDTAVLGAKLKIPMN
jgi:LysM repeat protein